MTDKLLPISILALASAVALHAIAPARAQAPAEPVKDVMCAAFLVDTGGLIGSGKVRAEHLLDVATEHASTVERWFEAGNAAPVYRASVGTVGGNPVAEVLCVR